MHLPLAAQLSVKCNCKTVRFVLYPGNQPETFRVAVNRKFGIIKIQSSRSVIVIFYHSTHRNMQMKLFQYFQCYIHLPPSAVHHDQIRKYLKASGFTFFLLFTQSMPESSGQYFIHTGIIIRTLHSFNFEFAVIVPFWFPMFIDYHRSDRIESVRIGNIICLHAYDAF